MDIFRAGDIHKRAEAAHGDLVAIKELLEQQCEQLQQLIDISRQSRSDLV